MLEHWSIYLPAEGFRGWFTDAEILKAVESDGEVGYLGNLRCVVTDSYKWRKDEDRN